MYYFENFPNIYYTFDKDLQQYYVLKNIFTRVNVISSVLQNSLVFYKYPWKDGDTLESIAFKYYGDPNRHWIILFANTMIDPYFDVPLNQNDFANNIIANYGSIEAAQFELDHIQKLTTVTTTVGGSSNTVTYTNTVTPEPYTYDFATNTLVQQTIPALGLNPVVTVSDTTVITPDGSIVETVITLTAVTAYDNEVAINETKREIMLIDPSYIPQIEAQFQNLLST